MAHEPCLAPATALSQPTAQRTRRPTVWSVAEAGAAFHRVLYKFYVTAVLN